MNQITKRIGRTLLVIALAIGLAGTAGAQFSLTSTYAAGNGQSGNMFDIKAIAGGVVINSFDVHLAAGLSATVEVWAVTGGGSYVGNEGTMSAWTMLASTMVTSAGTGVGTPLNLNLAHVIPPGQVQGYYVTTTASTLQYTNGTAVGAVFVADTFLEFYEGIGIAYPFGGTFTPRIWNGTIHYAPLSSVADDMALTAITSPVGQSLTCTPLSSTETVTVEMRNWGMNAVPAGSTLIMSYQVDAGPPVTEALLLANAVGLGQLVTYSFTTLADLSIPGPHNVTATVSYAADLDPSNDALTVNVDSGAAQITTYPFVEDFDGFATPGTAPPPGWGQEVADASGAFSDWDFTNIATPTPSTGPPSDNSGSGYYGYVSDAGEHITVDLRSPCFDLGALITPRLSFYLYSDNASIPFTNDAMLSIDVVSLTSGTTTPNAFGPIGHQGPMWTYQFLDLTPWFSETIQLVFRINTANGNVSHDIAIDDVAVYDPVATPGQGPQPGLAVLDINDARNGNQEPTYVPGNGPYYSTATIGGLIEFGFEGEPNRPIVLLTGPLNPVAATFVNVGQFDIGGPIDPMTGIPTALIVLADGGNAQGLNAFFVLGPTGETDLGFGIPNLPLGILGTFQAAIFTSGANGAPVALTNAVQVTLN